MKIQIKILFKVKILKMISIGDLNHWIIIEDSLWFFERMKKKNVTVALKTCSLFEPVPSSFQHLGSLLPSWTGSTPSQAPKTRRRRRRRRRRPLRRCNCPSLLPTFVCWQNVTFSDLLCPLWWPCLCPLGGTLRRWRTRRMPLRRLLPVEAPFSLG